MAARPSAVEPFGGAWRWQDAEVERGEDGEEESETQTGGTARAYPLEEKDETDGADDEEEAEVFRLVQMPRADKLP